MAEHCPGSVCFFALSGDNPVIKEHCAKGGRALFVRDQMIILADGAQEVHFALLDKIPADPPGNDTVSG